MVVRSCAISCSPPGFGIGVGSDRRRERPCSGKHPRHLSAEALKTRAAGKGTQRAQRNEGKRVPQAPSPRDPLLKNLPARSELSTSARRGTSCWPACSRDVRRQR